MDEDTSKKGEGRDTEGCN